MKSGVILYCFSFFIFHVSFAVAAVSETELRQTITQGLDWLASTQSGRGSWEATDSAYPCAMTGMAGIALLCEGSTPSQGKYSENIKKAVEFLLSRSRPNGLIGDPKSDDRYTYGHGFAMLFLSQVVGEEEYADHREEIIDVLTRAVEFTGKAQTRGGGWGYVSAADGNDFDEGSTTITQVQALRGCRNAGIPVPKEIIEKATKYIHRCSLQGGAGGVQYNTGGGGGRPPISAAAIACLYNAGEYDDTYVPKLLAYCDKMLPISEHSDGHWHYAHYYFAQVKYRQGGKEWETYRDKMYRKLIDQAASNGSWSQGYIGTVYTTAINLTILQLEKAALPIYQR
ncbi:MAG: terpene cyclase/mutase family protein [Planctomycetaceae bacterium]|nr:terpene cyclase/mutase family protein [Planctomycetaceae bacterium]